MRDRQTAAFLHGAAVSTSWADASCSLTDLIFRGVAAALSDAGIAMNAIDSVVLAAHDLVDGRSLSSMVTAPAAGAYLRDEIRLAEDGLAAASLGAARVEAGESRRTLVAAWGRASEGDFDATSRAAFDPFFQQPFGLREPDVSAFRLSAWLGRFPGREETRARAATARQTRARNNPRALRRATPRLAVNHPLRPEEASICADIVVAAVIGADPGPVRVAGVGHSTDLPALGDRDFLRMPAFRQAADRAFADAALGRDRVDVFELDGITLVDEVLALEAVGLCEAGEGFAAYAESGRANPSGGGACGWCYPAMGLVRLAECYLQLTAKAGGVQLPGTPRAALALGVSPIGAQSCTAMVLQAA